MQKYDTTFKIKICFKIFYFVINKTMILIQSNYFVKQHYILLFCKINV